MNKLASSAALTALVAATSLASSPANATSDTKSISTSLCRPLTAPDATGLVFDTRGVVNATDVNKRVICSVLKDGDSAYSATEDAFLFQYFRAGTVDGTVNCTYYLGPVGYPNLAAQTYTANGMATAGSGNYAQAYVSTYPAGWSHGGTSAVCTLSARTTLAFFYVVEGGATNTP